MSGRIDFRNLAAVLLETRALLARPETDFAWSGWEDREEALREVDHFIAQVRREAITDSLRLECLFAATGPIQETAISSGWSDDFVRLAGLFDKAIGAS